MALKEKWETLSQYLDARLIKSVRETFKFECIMPVQKAVIPHFCSHKDVIVEVDHRMNYKILIILLGKTN